MYLGGCVITGMCCAASTKQGWCLCFHSWLFLRKMSQKVSDLHREPSPQEIGDWWCDFIYLFIFICDPHLGFQSLVGCCFSTLVMLCWCLALPHGVFALWCHWGNLWQKHAWMWVQKTWVCQLSKLLMQDWRREHKEAECSAYMHGGCCCVLKNILKIFLVFPFYAMPVFLVKFDLACVEFSSLQFCLLQSFFFVCVCGCL